MEIESAGEQRFVYKMILAARESPGCSLALRDSTMAATAASTMGVCISRNI